jgi:hypothetical protein
MKKFAILVVSLIILGNQNLFQSHFILRFVFKLFFREGTVLADDVDEHFQDLNEQVFHGDTNRGRSGGIPSAEERRGRKHPHRGKRREFFDDDDINVEFANN